MFRSLDCEVIVYWPKNLLTLHNVELINQIYSLQIKWLPAFDGSKLAGYSNDYNRENVAFVNPSVKSFSKLTVQPVYVNTSAFYASFQLLKIIKTRQHNYCSWWRWSVVGCKGYDSNETPIFHWSQPHLSPPQSKELHRMIWDTYDTSILDRPTLLSRFVQLDTVPRSSQFMVHSCWPYSCEGLYFDYLIVHVMTTGRSVSGQRPYIASSDFVWSSLV